MDAIMQMLMPSGTIDGEFICRFFVFFSIADGLFYMIGSIISFGRR